MRGTRPKESEREKQKRALPLPCTCEQPSVSQQSRQGPQQAWLPLYSGRRICNLSTFISIDSAAFLKGRLLPLVASAVCVCWKAPRRDTQDTQKRGQMMIMPQTPGIR